LEAKQTLIAVGNWRARVRADSKVTDPENEQDVAQARLARRRRPVGAGTIVPYPFSGRGMARPQLIGMHPAWERPDGIEPARNVRMIDPADADLVREIKVTAHR
jgi:hypothetical protein